MAACDQMAELEAWFKDQCNGDWEHTSGIVIQTTDNPGWTVEIPIEHTDLEERPFTEIAEYSSENEPYLFCRIDNEHAEGRRFFGACSIGRFDELLSKFLTWQRNSR